MIYDRAMMCLCIISIMEASLLEKIDSWCCLGAVCTVATINRSRTFCFCNSSLVGSVHP
jgi:hypothetical protein